MFSLSSNEQLALLAFCKSADRLTATDMSRRLDLSVMGASKLLSRLEAQDMLASERIGNAKRFRLRYEHAFVRRLLTLLLEKEAEQARPMLRAWIRDLRRLEPHATIGIVFGSALERDDPRDLDVYLVTDERRVQALKVAIEDLEAVSPRTIHAVKQTIDEFERDHQDPVVRSAASGIVLFGYGSFVEVMERVTSSRYGWVVSEQGGSWTQKDRAEQGESARTPRKSGT